MKPSIYPITWEHPGQLFIMPKPSGEWLKEDVDHYSTMGVGTVVSMLEQSEINELLLQKEGSVCTDKGLNYMNFPVADRGLPDRDAFKELVHIVINCLINNEGVAVHCRAGIGRSGILVCCALAYFMGSAESAIEVVTQARGVKVPDTDEQHAFIVSVVEDFVN